MVFLCDLHVLCGKNDRFFIILINIGYQSQLKDIDRIDQLDIRYKKLYTISCTFYAIQLQHAGILDVKMAYIEYPDRSNYRLLIVKIVFIYYI